MTACAIYEHTKVSNMKKTAGSADFTAQDLVKAFRDVDQDVADEIMDIIQDVGSDRETSKAMSEIDKLIETHGVESIEGADQGRYWFNTVALYCNTGDTYAATILYNVAEGKFELTSYGEFIETHENDPEYFDASDRAAASGAQPSATDDLYARVARVTLLLENMYGSK